MSGRGGKREALASNWLRAKHWSATARAAFDEQFIGSPLSDASGRIGAVRPAGSIKRLLGLVKV